jgi:hypothetical protein
MRDDSGGRAGAQFAERVRQVLDLGTSRAGAMKIRTSKPRTGNFQPRLV